MCKLPNQALHRAAREFLAQHQGGARNKIRSSKYLNDLIEHYHRSIKLRLGRPDHHRWSSNSCAGSEKVSSKLGRLRIKDNRAAKIWNAVLAA
jgi:hypothetical protein